MRVTRRDEGRAIIGTYMGNIYKVPLPIGSRRGLRRGAGDFYGREGAPCSIVVDKRGA